MKRIFNYIVPRAKQLFNVKAYWRKLMTSKKHCKMSEGAQELNRIITRPHKDQWRRNDKK
jgi:hypothetical protein